MQQYTTNLWVPKFKLYEPTMDPSQDVDTFCAEVERVLGEGGYSSQAKAITEFAERLFSYCKLRGVSSEYEFRLMFARLAENPRRFVYLPRSDY